MTDKIWRFFTSLRLTVWTLGFAIVLVFLGTLAQVHEGLWDGQTRWFRSLVVVRAPGDVWWVPPIFPGGYLIGLVLLLNLLAAHLKRFQLTKAKVGINLTHFGIILMLVGGLATDLLSRESIMNFREGETRFYSEATRAYELVFTRPLDAQREEVVAIPAALLKTGAELRDPKLPFTVKVKNYWVNSEPSFRAPMQQNAPPLTDKGIAQDWDFSERKETKGMDDRNLPTAVLDLGEHGVWVVPSWASEEAVIEGVKRSYTRSVGADVAAGIAAKLAAPQEIEVGGQKWRMALRPERHYKPFSVTLLKTTHEIYLGTATSMNPQGIPKNFQSRVRIDHPAKGETREVDIYMNNPLRYEGLTFYQSTMGRDEVVDVGRSGLQVVRNPSWLIPYLSCLIVGLGLTWQFGYHLVSFLHKRRAAASQP
jgi:hypothetical protein